MAEAVDDLPSSVLNACRTLANTQRLSISASLLPSTELMMWTALCNGKIRGADFTLPLRAPENRTPFLLFGMICLFRLFGLALAAG